MRLPVLALACLSLAGCGEGQATGVAIEDAWVRLPASGGEPGSAYFTLSSDDEGTKLLGVTSPLVRWVELHESRISRKGVVKMERRREVEFPSRGKLLFEPGGRHAMLFGIDKSVRPGGTVPLTFAFNTAPPVTVDAEVRAVSGEAHAEHSGR